MRFNISLENLSEEEAFDHYYNGDFSITGRRCKSWIFTLSFTCRAKKEKAKKQIKVASEVEGQLADPSNQFSFSLSLASERENPSFTLWRWGGILARLFIWNSFLFVIFFGEIFKRWNFQEQCIFTSSCLVPRIFASQIQKQICFPPNFNEGKGAQCAMCTQRENICGDPCCKYDML